MTNMRKYSILFIDDEEVIRKSFLKLVNWEEHQFDVVGVYKNGEAAWEYLINHVVDIIVTDINMPFMDGISLLENIRRESSGTRVILLTGYEYFEYAQKAVELKAFDFLLKPVQTERLLGAVKKAALDIEKEEMTAKAVGKSLEISQSYFINELLYGKIEKTAIKGKAQELQIATDAESYMSLMVAVDAKIGENISEDVLIDLKRNVQDAIEREKKQMEELAEVTFDMYFARNISVNIPILMIAQERTTFAEDFIEMFMKRIMGSVKESADYQLTLAIGKEQRKIEEIPQSFICVINTLKNRHISGIGKMIYVSETIQERKVTDQIVLPTDTLLHHIRMGMTQEVEKDIKKIYEGFRHKEYLSLQSAKMVTTELAITAFKGEISSKDESVSYLYYLNHIQHLHTLNEMEHDITQFAIQIAEKRKQGGNHKKKIAEQAVDYLKSNYSNEELSLNDVARFLNISVPYLAVLFKQKTNRNFSAHLLEIRMEQAKELLRTTGLTVGEISERVGYSSPQYFAVCFKKYEGISPGNYREQI